MPPAGPLKWLCLCAIVVLCGCATRPAWLDDPQAATLRYWYDQPASVRVYADDYRDLWDAAQNARRRFGFEETVKDYRGGLLATGPRVGGQFFEPWRDEHRTVGDVVEASRAAVRRRLRFTFGRDGERFWVEPRAVVEAEARSPGFGREAGDDPRRPRFGWHAAGRDVALEASLADRIADRAGGTKRFADEATLAALRR